jgi:diaminopimelate decarboxylase
MDSFAYADGRMQTDGVDLARIADAVGTPAYVYSSAALEDTYRRFAAALAPLDPLICYAVKANSNLAVIGTFARLGAGADVVSVGEMARALAAGVPADRIVFAGVGKRRDEMAAALKAGILQFNVESEPELLALNEVAVSLGLRATASLRVNPDIDAGTHPKITTGSRDNKFGVDIASAMRLFETARGLPGIDLSGVAVHIGSQLTDISPLRDTFAAIARLVRELRGRDHAIRRIDLGGGIGIAYQGETVIDPAEYARVVMETVGDLGAKLIVEPGRSLVGNAGVLLARVIYVKQGEARRFVILDAAMNDLLRPALYEAFHDIAPLVEPPANAEEAPVDIVGPVCESADRFAAERMMPPLAAGDLVAIKSAGAYAAVMASTYNSRPIAAEVLARAGDFAVIKPRQEVSALFADEIMPPWLSGGAHG